DDTALIVYRKDRYCPFTSLMPQSYEQQIRQVPGVASVVPMKIVVSNCRTSLDVVTFRGVPRESFLNSMQSQFELIDGTIGEWERRSDAALLGETLATRRGLRVGDRFEAAGITAYVAGLIRSEEAQDQNVAYVHLDFLQFASGSRSGGIVTQFLVKVDDPASLDTVAKSIDEMFAPAQEPTSTSAEKAFVGRAANDIIEIVGFMKILGWGCLGAVLALVGNAIVLSVQDRIREHAILQTLGFKSEQIARLIVSEGMLLSLVGALVGSTAATLFLKYSALAMSVDGFSLPIHATYESYLVGVLLAVGLGILAGVVPAWQASRRDIVSCFRAV
ncbi:MAG: ABC transporter permease, partial [Phycisphaerae bacterium]